MISLPPSPAFTISISDRLYAENDSPLVSPKRSFAQLEEDPLSQLVPKRRDVARRAPLDPLSASDWENRRYRDTQSTDSAMYHALVAPTAVSDLWGLRPEHPVSSTSCGAQRSDISDALVCSWPPPIPTPGTAGSSHNGFTEQQASQPGRRHSPDEKNPSRASFLDSTSTAWDPSDSLTTEPTTTTMNKSTGWKSENVHQPIRSRTNAMPSIRRPPGELWRPNYGPIKVDAVASQVPSTPPGLSSQRSELRRCSSSSDLLPHGSVSLSLALGSQPLRASDHTKAVSPIGAERSRVISITSFKSHTRNSPATQSHALSNSPWCFSPPSPAPQAKRNNELSLSSTTSPENSRVPTGVPSMSKENLRHLLRQTVRNKYAPKVISPLSPLRTANSAPALSTDPEYRLRMPSPSNIPSPRYSNCPPRRARTVCEAFQSLDWNSTCMHCQECKRDTIGKRLLAFRYRQQQTRHVQRNKFLAFPSRAATPAIMGDNRIALADRIRDVFAYEVDEEERSLWEEVAAVTGVAPVSFSRAGAPCAASAYRPVVDNGNRDGIHANCNLDEGLLANESATLVSVY